MHTRYDQFCLPKDGPIYIERVFSRCKDLITFSIWNGLHLSRLRSWINNFTTDEERYFAARLLDALIYRSTDQTLSLLVQLFQRSLVDLTRLDPPSTGPIFNWLERLSGDCDPGIRLVPVWQTTDPISKSAGTILRFMKRHLHVNENWIIQPPDIDSCVTAGVSIFVFVDDFLGTGTQFSDFITAERLRPYLTSAYFVYAPLVAHAIGMQLLETLPELRVTTTEFLDDRCALFSSTSGYFDDGTNTPDQAREFYYTMLARKRIGIVGPNRTGFGHLELAYAFEHACPDNSLPLLWWSKSPDWHPLFDR